MPEPYLALPAGGQAFAKSSTPIRHASPKMNKLKRKQSLTVSDQVLRRAQKSGDAAIMGGNWRAQRSSKPMTPESRLKFRSLLADRSRVPTSAHDITFADDALEKRNRPDLGHKLHFYDVGGVRTSPSSTVSPLVGLGLGMAVRSFASLWMAVRSFASLWMTVRSFALLWMTASEWQGGIGDDGPLKSKGRRFRQP